MARVKSGLHVLARSGGVHPSPRVGILIKRSYSAMHSEFLVFAVTQNVSFSSTLLIIHLLFFPPPPNPAATALELRLARRMPFQFGVAPPKWDLNVPRTNGKVMIRVFGVSESLK